MRAGFGCDSCRLKKLRADGKIRSNETVVLVLTGHTLKDADYTIDFHRGNAADGRRVGGQGSGDWRAEAQCGGS